MGDDNIEKAKQLLGRVKDLPTLPVVLEKIVALTKDPDVSISEVEEAIGTDPVISTKLLRIVNSAYYSFFREITSIRQSIVVLGIDSTKNLVQGTSIISAFGHRSTIKMFPLQEFWKYSVACGNISRTLASLLDYQFYEEAFLAGLIHNIGKIVFANFLSDPFEQSILMSSEKNIRLSLSEEKIIGFNHNEMGYVLATHWKLPQLLNEVIFYSEYPSRADEYQEITCVVRLASILCRNHGIGVSGEPDTNIELREDEAWHILGAKNPLLESIDFDRFSLTLEEEIEKVESFVQAIFP